MRAKPNTASRMLFVMGVIGGSTNIASPSGNSGYGLSPRSNRLVEGTTATSLSARATQSSTRTSPSVDWGNIIGDNAHMSYPPAPFWRFIFVVG